MDAEDNAAKRRHDGWTKNVMYELELIKQQWQCRPQRESKGTSHANRSHK